jgi:predicted nucleic acid-binding protein
MMRILLDTNIVIDFASKREDFYEESKKIFSLAVQQKCKAYLTATTVTDIFYILRKENGREQTVGFLKEIFQIVDVLGIDKTIIMDALYSGWGDFEDAVQMQAATQNLIDAIVTRNTKDFKKSENIRILTPSELLAQLNN